ncbi:MAG: selenocysteine-specific translation elongation factor [Gemmatimonadaceae bacterium]
MILGTAGHVDHGKTTLVKALTGVDTDRLPEEKRRGITIDLGFAPLSLPGGGTLGVVDVPGHEAFVRTMLAGATGVDLALLVIAADEGVMPQTREHLDILTLLGVRGGVVALTKTDLVDRDWLELVREDARDCVSGSALSGAPILATSAATATGLEDLLLAVAHAAAALPQRDANDLFRLPVDRVFTVRGTGTVVTGTVWSGSIQRDSLVRILPGDRSARVRGIEMHGQNVDRAQPGTRTALALSGVNVSDVTRGMTLVSDPGWQESRTVLAEVALLDEALLPGPLGARTQVRFHLGTSDVAARVVCRGGPLARGVRRQARIVLSEPIVARAGDRFVLRSASPPATIGGGIVGDPFPEHRRARPWLDEAATAGARLSRVLDEAGTTGVDIRSLPVKIGAAQSEVEQLRSSLDGALQVGERLFAAAAIEEVALRLIAVLEDFHRQMPLEPGAPVQLVRSRLGRGADNALVERVLRLGLQSGAVEIDGSLLCVRGWRPAPSTADEHLAGKLLEELSRAGREPPSAGELSERLGAETSAILRHLERGGHIVQVEPDRYYARSSVVEMVAALRAGLQKDREYGPPAFRGILGTSRKYLIPFLEFCDRTGVTERKEQGRVLIA